MSDDILSQLYEHFFAIPNTTVYAVFDGASVPGLPQMLMRMSIASTCLTPGELEPEMAQVAPYLAVLQRDTAFAEWVVQEGWGRHWGIFAISSVDLRTLRDHLRSFLTVYDPQLQPLNFRYYDPRVLRVYLPTCNTRELQTVFGPVVRYLMEGMEGDEPKTLLKFWREGTGQLGRESVALK